MKLGTKRPHYCAFIVPIYIASFLNPHWNLENTCKCWVCSLSHLGNAKLSNSLNVLAIHKVTTDIKYSHTHCDTKNIFCPEFTDSTTFQHILQYRLQIKICWIDSLSITDRSIHATKHRCNWANLSLHVVTPKQMSTSNAATSMLISFITISM